MHLLLLTGGFVALVTRLSKGFCALELQTYRLLCITSIYRPPCPKDQILKLVRQIAIVCSLHMIATGRLLHSQRLRGCHCCYNCIVILRQLYYKYLGTTGLGFYMMHGDR